MPWGRYSSKASFVTALPTTGLVDGQEVYYQSTIAGTGGGATNTMATVGAVWHLRYRAASASAYKWEAVGAPPVGEYAVGGRAYYTRESTGSVYHAALTTVGPRVKAPLAGDYQVSFSAIAYETAAGGAPTVAIVVGSETPTAWSTNDSLDYLGAAGVTVPLAGTRARTAAALDYIELLYATSNAAGPAEFYNRNLTITPIRVG
jgi:hypothetical protein